MILELSYRGETSCICSCSITLEILEALRSNILPKDLLVVCLVNLFKSIGKGSKPSYRLLRHQILQENTALVRSPKRIINLNPKEDMNMISLFSEASLPVLPLSRAKCSLSYRNRYGQNNQSRLHP